MKRAATDQRNFFRPLDILLLHTKVRVGSYGLSHINLDSAIIADCFLIWQYVLALRYPTRLFFSSQTSSLIRRIAVRNLYSQLLSFFEKVKSIQVRARKDMISYSECIHSINTLLSLFNASSTVEVFIRAIVFILLHNGKYFFPIYTARTGLIILRSTKAISKPRRFPYRDPSSRQSSTKLSPTSLNACIA